ISRNYPEATVKPNRREFLERAGCIIAAGSQGILTPSANASAHAQTPANAMGVLVDLGVCIGCRQCEYACKNANDIDAGTLESYDDQSVFRSPRRPGPTELTVLNSWAQDEKLPVYVKTNCM